MLQGAGRVGRRALGQGGHGLLGAGRAGRRAQGQRSHGPPIVGRRRSSVAGHGTGEGRERGAKKCTGCWGRRQRLTTCGRTNKIRKGKEGMLCKPFIGFVYYGELFVKRGTKTAPASPKELFVELRQCLAPALLAPAPCLAALCRPVLVCSKEPDGSISRKNQHVEGRSWRSHGFGAPVAPPQYYYST